MLYHALRLCRVWCLEGVVVHGKNLHGTSEYPVRRSIFLHRLSYPTNCFHDIGPFSGQGCWFLGGVVHVRVGKEANSPYLEIEA